MPRSSRLQTCSPITTEKYMVIGTLIEAVIAMTQFVYTSGYLLKRYENAYANVLWKMTYVNFLFGVFMCFGVVVCIMAQLFRTKFLMYFNVCYKAVLVIIMLMASVLSFSIYQSLCKPPTLADGNGIMNGTYLVIRPTLSPTHQLECDDFRHLPIIGLMLMVFSFIYIVTTVNAAFYYTFYTPRSEEERRLLTSLT